MSQNGETAGYPVQIVKITNEQKFELDVEALGYILLSDAVRDTPMVVVSIAGHLRKVTNLYLYKQIVHAESFPALFPSSMWHFRFDDRPWLADSDAPLTGFSWRCGPELDTTGILMLSACLYVVIKTDDGKELLIL